MQIKSIKTAAAGVLLLGGLAVLSTCGDNRRTLKKIAAENNYTKSEIKAVLKNTRNDSPMFRNAERQAIIDSIAYRSIFNNTVLANDKQAVYEFEKTSEKLRISDMQYLADDEFIRLNEKDGISHSELDSLKKASQQDSHKWLLPKKIGAFKQFQYDKYFYTKLFDKLGLSRDKNFNKAFDDISKKIKP